MLAASLYLGLYVLERRRPLRRVRQSKVRRNARNLAVAGLTATALQIAERPLVVPLSRAVDRHEWGLLPRLRLPKAMETAIAVVLLDYTLYAWHVLTHRVPWLWRFHKVHHEDLEMDASTALRFHFGEIVISVAWRAAQVFGLGIRPGALTAWQAFLMLSILFHHSNLRLPLAFERRLARIVMTPRLHGIHHSSRPGEGECNWSSGLTVWDWLHGTLRGDVRQGSIPLGVREYRDPRELRLPDVLAQPFQPQRGPRVPVPAPPSRNWELAS